MATATPTENEELDDRIIEDVISRGELDLVDDLFANDYVMHNPDLPEEIHGPEAFKEYVRMERSAFPDLTCSAEARVIEGNTVATRFTNRGTHEGEFMGIDPTGSEVTVSGIVINRYDNGKLVETHVVGDSLGLLQQLGVVELPGE